jgi:predicted nuclease of predicted toxin-antitoxin system
VRLLLDENLSPRVVRLLADIYPECVHVHTLGMDRASDTEIWAYAIEHSYTIISKDADFHQRSLVLGSPPKVIWLRLGNCSVARSAEVLRERYIAVRHFVEEADAAFLALS